MLQCLPSSSIKDQVQRGCQEAEAKQWLQCKAATKEAVTHAARVVQLLLHQASVGTSDQRLATCRQLSARKSLVHPPQEICMLYSLCHKLAQMNVYISQVVLPCPTHKMSISTVKAMKSSLPDRLNASKKVRSPSSLRNRFCRTSISCRVPFSRKCRRNWLAVLLLKKDRSNSLMCLNRSRSMSSFLVATMAATAATCHVITCMCVHNMLAGLCVGTLVIISSAFIKLKPRWTERINLFIKARLAGGFVLQRCTLTLPDVKQQQYCTSCAWHSPIDPTLLPAMTLGSRPCWNSDLQTPCSEAVHQITYW